MENIEGKCALIVDIASYNDNLYSDECIKKMKEEALKYQEEVDSFLTKDYIKSCLSDKDKRMVVYYAIYLREDLIEDIKEEAIEYLLNIYNEKYKVDKVALDILMLHTKLNDDIVSKIISYIDTTNSKYSPFDWRYHIIKREEISDDLKRKVCKTYTKYIGDILDEIRWDLESEISSLGITEENKGNFPVFLDELRAYETLLNYEKAKEKVYE